MSAGACNRGPHTCKECGSAAHGKPACPNFKPNNKQARSQPATATTPAAATKPPSKQ
jgi:hypothetical protein